MGKRRYPPLKPSEVVAILTAKNFKKKRQDGSHAHYEFIPEQEGGQRQVVTVDMSVSDFWEDIIKSMIRQSGLTREQFYGATKGTKKKL